MINSLLMLGGSSNKNISKIFIVVWIAYMLFGSNLSLGIIFPIVNAITFLTITLLISKIKNKSVNAVLSITSILIWSVIIDIICYYLYPTMSSNITLIQYVFNGILFNYKYVFTNILALSLVKILSSIKINIKAKVRLQENAILDIWELKKFFFIEKITIITHDMI